MRNPHKQLFVLEENRVPWYDRDDALINSLVAYWPLDEASGNRTDIINGIVLTDTNTVTSDTGITAPLAASLTIANSECLIATDSASLSQLDWGAVWFKPSSVAVSSTIIGKFHTTGNREWMLVQVNASLIYQVSPDGTATANGSVTITGALTAGEWHLAVWFHDAANDLIGLSLNGEPFRTSAHSTGMFDSLASFDIGRQSSGGAFFGGLVQDAYVGKGYRPTMLDVHTLYNSRVNNGVKRMTFLGYGGEVDWSLDGNTIAFDRRDDSGVYQLHTFSPNGTGEVCISDTEASPASTLHKGWPSFHPSGDYIVCQVEQSDSPDIAGLAEPGRGWWNNVWVCTLDGSQWWQLTDYAVANVNGVLVPRFSPDGTKLLWAKKIGAVDAETAPLAVWNLQLADFEVVEGVPTISNIVELTPGSKTFYEAHGFSRDGSKLVFTSDPDTGNLYGFDVFACDLDGTNVVNLTGSDAQWDEHAHYAKHGDHISYLSSRPYPAYTAEAVTGLMGETYVMSATGTNRRLVTGFNIEGLPEYDAEASVATSCSWQPGGQQLVVVQLLLGDSYDTVEGRRIWLVDFNGVYA